LYWTPYYYPGHPNKNLSLCLLVFVVARIIITHVVIVIVGRVVDNITHLLLSVVLAVVDGSGNRSSRLLECVTAAWKALSRVNAKGTGTDGLVIRSLD
jgi:hypothetical protein